jgi:hypothetical protein
VVEGAGVDVDGSVAGGAVVAGSVDDVDVCLVGGSVVEVAGVDVDGSVAGGAVVAACVEDVDDCVVGAAVDDVGSCVVVGCVVVVPLSWTSCATMRRTAAPWV